MTSKLLYFTTLILLTGCVEEGYHSPYIISHTPEEEAEEQKQESIPLSDTLEMR